MLANMYVHWESSTSTLLCRLNRHQNFAHQIVLPVLLSMCFWLICYNVTIRLFGLFRRYWNTYHLMFDVAYHLEKVICRWNPYDNEQYTLYYDILILKTLIIYKTYSLTVKL